MTDYSAKQEQEQIEKHCRDCVNAEKLGVHTIRCSVCNPVCFGWDNGCDKYVERKSELVHKTIQKLMVWLRSFIYRK